ncbi:MAG: methyltransferase domain-containing protein [Halanaerobiales bacterium]|nr:methyltransferase domain-containing protein [Halanaerobiales bacterium]
MLNKMNLLKNGKLSLNLIKELSEKPEIFAPGNALFWNDPHISEQMLAAHLHPEWDAASRKHSIIDQSVEWLVKRLNVKGGEKILDLGCGPGLYCTRFYQNGLNVTGMDLSENSINYAVNQAKENNQSIEYINQNYLTMDFEDRFDIITLIYCDFGVLCDEDRDLLLKKIYRALKPGGTVVFDLFTKNNPKEIQESWSFQNGGFWNPNPHLLLSKVFHYPDDEIYLDQYIVITEDGNLKQYRIWEHYYSVETITPILEKAGFIVEEVWSDLTGTLYHEKSESIAIMAKKSLDKSE